MKKIRVEKNKLLCLEVTFVVSKHYYLLMSNFENNYLPIFAFRNMESEYIDSL